MSLITTTSKYVGLSSDPNADVEIDAKASSFCITSTDIEHDLQDEDAITPDTAIRTAIRSMRLCILYIIAMIGLLIVGVSIMCGTSGEGAILGVLLGGVVLIVIGALLLCLPIAVMIRDCYRKDPTQAIRGFSIVLGMWAAAIAGSFVGIYPILRLGIGKPWALVFGVSSSLLTCFILACRRKTLLIQNMLHRFYDMQFVTLMVAPVPIVFLSIVHMIMFFDEAHQETVRTAELDLFIGTVFWQFLFLTASTMTWYNLVGLGLGYDFRFLATITVWPFLLYQIYKKSASFVDWLIATHGQQHLIRMLVPNYEIINDTEDKKVVGEPGAALELI